MPSWLSRWWKSTEADQDWLAVTLRPPEIAFVVGRYAPQARATITRYGTRALATEDAALERTVRELHLGRHRCETVLASGEYQLLQVEAPNVPPAELKSAIRWRIKDMIDYHVDDATLDLLDIPNNAGSPSRSHSMYAVAAKNDVVEREIRRFEGADLPLTVIDIPETAQRNIAALHETEGRALALLYLGTDSGLLTINFRGEMYLARRMDMGQEQIARTQDSAREEMYTRLLVELQRTFDHFERQYPLATVATLMLAPEPGNSGILEFLSRNLGLPVSRVALGEVLEFAGGEPPAPEEQWKLFHLFGAVLRHETKVL